jgi:hypothetical protein
VKLAHRFAALVAALLACVAPASATPATEAEALARAAGNRPDVAVRIGRALFRTVWPAQLVKIRVDGVGTHVVAGLVISGVKFHSRLGAAAFSREVAALVGGAFGASDVEEVDVWATVPLAAVPRETVGGDLAQPTTRIVYAASVPRTERAAFAARLRRGDDVYWDPGWRARLGR